MTKKNVSRHCQMSLVGGRGTKSSPIENHRLKVINRNVLLLANAKEEGIQQHQFGRRFSGVQRGTLILAQITAALHERVFWLLYPSGQVNLRGGV